MKNSFIKFLLGICVIILSTVISSCSNDEEPRLVGMDVVDCWEFNLKDTIVSPESHEIMFHLAKSVDLEHHPFPNDWNFFSISQWIRMNEQPWGEEGFENGENWTLLPRGPIYDEYESEKDGRISTDWAEMVKIPGDPSPQLKLTLPKNDTGKDRGLRIIIYSQKEGLPNRYFTAQVCVMQKAEPEIVPVKIKYHGKEYSSMASLSSNHLEYLDPEFAAVMEEINSKENVRAIVLDNQTVSFFDADDAKTSAALDALSRSVDADAENMEVKWAGNSRSSDPFQFLDTDKLAYMSLYEHLDFDGRCLYVNLPNPHYSFDVPTMSQYYLNDQITSLALAYSGTDPEICTVLTVWQNVHFNFGDDTRARHRMSFVATHDNPRLSIGDLRQMMMLGTNSSWSDVISSSSLHFGYWDRALLDY